MSEAFDRLKAARTVATKVAGRSGEPPARPPRLRIVLVHTWFDELLTEVPR